MSSDDEIQFVSENKETSNNRIKNSTKYFQEEKFKTYKEEEEIDSDVEEINTTNESKSNKEQDTTNELHTDTDQEKHEQSSDIEDQDDEDTSNLPSGAECLKRSKEFAEVTGTDTALAMFYLQDTKWDLEVTFNILFYVPKHK